MVHCIDTVVFKPSYASVGLGKNLPIQFITSALPLSFLSEFYQSQKDG